MLFLYHTLHLISMKGIFFIVIPGWLFGQGVFAVEQRRIVRLAPVRAYLSRAQLARGHKPFLAGEHHP